MTKPCRIGIIGAGAMGLAHLDLLTHNLEFEVVGIADPNAAALAPLSARGIATYPGHLKMLDSAQPDAVIIASPNSMHVSAALDCIERRVGVLIEKPVADSVKQAQSLLRVMERTDVPVLVGHHRRHNPLLQRASQHIASGGIGKVVAVVGMWLRRKPDEYFKELWKLDPNRGGGVLLINTIHDIDCLRMLCGDIETVQAMTSNATRGLIVEDTAAVTLRFTSGALATLTVSDATTAPWCWEMTSQEDLRFATTPENCYIVCGTQGSLTVPTLETWTNEPNAGRDAPLIRRRLYHLHVDALTQQLRHFAAVMRGECKPLVTASDAARSLAATLAIRQSAVRGEAIRVAEMFD